MLHPGDRRRNGNEEVEDREDTRKTEERGRGTNAGKNEERMAKRRITRRVRRMGEEVEKKTSTRQNGKQWVVLYRGIETEYVL